MQQQQTSTKKPDTTQEQIFESNPTPTNSNLDQSKVSLRISSNH
ncbi:MAG: hypothetical protein ACK521_07510 [bacterium]